MRAAAHHLHVLFVPFLPVTPCLTTARLPPCYYGYRTRAHFAPDICGPRLTRAARLKHCAHPTCVAYRLPDTAFGCCCRCYAPSGRLHIITTGAGCRRRILRLPFFFPAGCHVTRIYATNYLLCLVNAGWLHVRHLLLDRHSFIVVGRRLPHHPHS